MGAPQYEQAGADIGGTGTTNTIPRWTGPSTLGDSGLIDNGTAVYTTTRNVGIGTASPASVLHVRNNTAGITLDSTLGSGRQYQLNPLRTGVSNAGFEIRDVTAGAAVISIDASQNVGIGTASPSAKLHVNGNAVCASGTTGMTDGFFYIPGAAGAPSGTPTAVSGRVPMYYDTTNNKFYVYNGAWKAVTLA